MAAAMREVARRVKPSRMAVHPKGGGRGGFCRPDCARQLLVGDVLGEGPGAGEGQQGGEGRASCDCGEHDGGWKQREGDAGGGWSDKEGEAVERALDAGQALERDR